MTKRQIEAWRTESIEQALVRLTIERFTELQKAVRAAGEVH